MTCERRRATTSVGIVASRCPPVASTSTSSATVCEDGDIAGVE
jgi:hypothetical protein